MMTITKRQLRTALAVEHDAVIADFFGISASAVSQWEEDQPIPELRRLQLQLKRPDLVAADSEAV